LKFNIRDIGPEGRSVARTLGDAAVRALLAEVGVEPTPGRASLQLDLELSRAEADDSVVLVRGSVNAQFSVPCGRCLASASIEANEPDLRLTFLPPARRPSEEELSVEDLDTYSHDGEEIDLRPVIREILVLSMPMSPLCRPECKGICGGCGADLNVEACKCATRESEKTPWGAALSKLKKSSQQG